MSAEFIYDWGQEVRVTSTVSEISFSGQVGSVCGMRSTDETRLYLVEFPNGEAIEIPEEFLEFVKQE